MELKRFVAPDMRRALNLVSEELGADAVILSNKKVPEGIEITAAIDYDPDLYMQYALQQQQAEEQARQPGLNPAEALSTATGANPGVNVSPPSGQANASANTKPEEFETLLEQQQANESESLAWLRKYGKSIFTNQNEADMKALNARLNEMAASDNKPSINSKQPVAINGREKVRKIAENFQNNNQRKKQQAASAVMPKTPAESPKKPLTIASNDNHEASQESVSAQEIADLKQELLDLKLQLDGDASEQRVERRPVKSRRAKKAAVNTVDKAAKAKESQLLDMPGEAPAAVTPELKPETKKKKNTQLSTEELKAVRVLKKKHAQEVKQLQSELALVKELFQNSLNQNQWEMLNIKRPQTVHAFKQLRGYGLSSRLCEQYLQQASAQHADPQMKEILRDIESSIPIYIRRPGQGMRVISLVGPTGSGKTTTIAKLAAQFALQHGADKLAIITTDTFRLGAFEQLKVLGKILNVPIRVANEKRSVTEILNSLHKKELVLIDTAGINNSEEAWQAQWEQLQPVQNRIENFLIIPATSHEKVLRRCLSDYDCFNPIACVLSKLDESQSLGEALSIVIEKRLPVAYVTDGQEIPKDIDFADKKKLMRSMIDIAEISELSELSDLDLAISFDDVNTGDKAGNAFSARIA